MSLKKIAFFDLNIIGIGRYPLLISNEINKEISGVYFYFLYEEDPNNKLHEIKSKLPSNSEILKIKKANYFYIRNLMKNISVDSLLVMAQRIPDSALVSVSNELGIKTFKFQHGLYIPFMKRGVKIFFFNIFKIIRYFQYSLVIAKVTGISNIEILTEYANIFLKGKKITNTSLPLDNINVNRVFVYGEYWKKYHNEEFGYKYKQQTVVGYPDLMQLEKIKQNQQEKAICYICQTLVEDGRIARKSMENFIEILSQTIGSKKIYIKLHPRSDVTLYKALENRKNIVFTKLDFPNCTKYIGHYSSMLAISMYLTDDIFLWDFDGHNKYPFYLVHNAKILSKNPDELLMFIENTTTTTTISNNISSYFSYNKDTIKFIGKEII